MLKSNYLNFLLLNILFGSSFIVFNNLFFYIDIIVIIFLVFTCRYEKKLSFYHIFISGILYDFVYPKFAGIGILLFFILYILKNAFSWIWDLSSARVRFSYFATAVLVYKIFGSIVFGGNFVGDLTKSYIVTLTLLYMIDFISGNSGCFSDT